MKGKKKGAQILRQNRKGIRHPLFDGVLRARHPRLCLVTFNDDLLLEFALQDFGFADNCQLSARATRVKLVHQ